jgi:DNA-binding transcriptional LysR family regulator
MEMQQLQNFYVIAQCESLTKAAQKLHTSQPSLSRSLHSLENELGAPLFDRVGRNIVLNDAGRFALSKVVDVLDSAESIKLDISDFIHNKNFSVDIYSPVPMGEFEDIIIGFKEQYPNVRLRMASWNSSRLKSVQPSITFFASPHIHKEPNYLLLGEEQVCLAVSRNNPLSKVENVSLASLSNAPFVSTLCDSPFYSIITEMFSQAGFKPNTVIEDQDYNRVMSYVAHDFGIALAPSITWFGRWREQHSRQTLSLFEMARKFSNELGNTSLQRLCYQAFQ